MSIAIMFIILLLFIHVDSRRLQNLINSFKYVNQIFDFENLDPQIPQSKRDYSFWLYLSPHSIPCPCWISILNKQSFLRLYYNIFSSEIYFQYRNNSATSCCKYFAPIGEPILNGHHLYSTRTGTWAERKDIQGMQILEEYAFGNCLDVNSCDSWLDIYLKLSFDSSPRYRIYTNSVTIEILIGDSWIISCFCFPDSRRISYVREYSLNFTEILKIVFDR